jgi:hypothetical protein
MTDHIVVKAPHAGLPRHTTAIAQTIAFLHNGRFNSDEADHAAERRSCA